VVNHRIPDAETVQASTAELMQEVIWAINDRSPERLEGSFENFHMMLMLAYCHSFCRGASPLVDMATTVPLGAMVRSLVGASIHLNYVAASGEEGHKEALCYWNKQYATRLSQVCNDRTANAELIAQLESRLAALRQAARELGMKRLRKPREVKELARDIGGDQEFANEIQRLHGALSDSVHAGMAALVAHVGPSTDDDANNLGTIALHRDVGESLHIAYVAIDAETSAAVAVASASDWPHADDLRRLRTGSLGTLEEWVRAHRGHIGNLRRGTESSGALLEHDAAKTTRDEAEY